MSNSHKVVNVVIAGLGGQGVIKASDVLADAAFLAGHDAKKSEIHGMSQRGGSVASDVRFGENVLSPMVPSGEADYLAVLDPGQVENNRHHISRGGMLIEPRILLGEAKSAKALDKDDSTPLNSRNFNIAMLGALSTHLDIPQEHWESAIRKNLPEKLHEQNFEVFALGRERAQAAKQPT
ncbi:MAG TPA: pyruvate ferredoxin oxidoreductase [Candidatus Hydrogenedentes bacterium]|nr:pyruvate ferredoxin oxidoreductase [Candidatus Hydrogenedentota bacterium]